MTTSVRVGFPGTDKTRIIFVGAYPTEAEKGFYAVGEDGQRLEIDDDGFPIVDVEPDPARPLKLKHELESVAPAEGDEVPTATVKKTANPAKAQG